MFLCLSERGGMRINGWAYDWNGFGWVMKSRGFQVKGKRAGLSGYSGVEMGDRCKQPLEKNSTAFPGFSAQSCLTRPDLSEPFGTLNGWYNKLPREHREKSKIFRVESELRQWWHGFGDPFELGVALFFVWLTVCLNRLNYSKLNEIMTLRVPSFNKLSSHTVFTIADATKGVNSLNFFARYCMLRSWGRLGGGNSAV